MDSDLLPAAEPDREVKFDSKHINLMSESSGNGEVKAVAKVSKDGRAAVLASKKASALKISPGVDSLQKLPVRNLSSAQRWKRTTFCTRCADTSF